MNPEYNFAFLDEGSKREIRRSILKAVAVPGYQVPFGSRELPIGRGWGTGGIQLTLSLIGPRDVLKVIDQGSDDSVNAVNIKKFINLCSDVATTTDSTEATLIQTRHRIPEEPLRNDQLLVFQVPLPEPLGPSTVITIAITPAPWRRARPFVRITLRNSGTTWRRWRSREYESEPSRAVRRC